MSYEVTVVIRCDEPGCAITWFDTRRNRGGLNKTMAAVFAASQGWIVRSGNNPIQAYCPDHREVRP